jgi:hypothetical protein
MTTQQDHRHLQQQATMVLMSQGWQGLPGLCRSMLLKPCC